MDLQPSGNEKSPTQSKQNPSTTKCSPRTTSFNKVLIITPEQIAKLGLTQQINKAIQSQVNSPPKSQQPFQGSPRKRNVRVSKITIINPKSSGSDSAELKNKEIEKSIINTSPKSEVASIMKNKLSNLLKSRPAFQIPSTSGIQNLKNDREIKSSKLLGRKRKIVSFEDDDDDDDVLVESPSLGVKILPKEDPIKLEKEEEPILVDNPSLGVKILPKDNPIKIEKEEFILVDSPSLGVKILPKDNPIKLVKEEEPILVDSPSLGVKILPKDNPMKIEMEEFILVDSPSLGVKILPKDNPIELVKEEEPILVDSPSLDVKILPKDDTIKLVKEETTIASEDVKNVETNLNNKKANLPQISETKIRRPKIKLVPNIKRVSNKIQEPPKEKLDKSSVINSSQICDDVKQKIHVLSNEQISLPHTYIASLKSHSPEKVSTSAPIFIYKSANSNNSNIIDVKSKEENNKDTKIDINKKLCNNENQNTDVTLEKPSVIVEVDQEPLPVSIEEEPLKTKNQEPREEKEPINPKNLSPRFVDKDGMLLINDTTISDLFSDGENENVITNTSNNSKSNKSNIESNLPVIDLTENEELQTKKDTESIPENPKKIKSRFIKNLAGKVKNKIDNLKHINSEKKMELKVIRTYGRKKSSSSNFSKEIPETSISEKSKSTEEINSEPILQNPQPLNIVIETNTEVEEKINPSDIVATVNESAITEKLKNSENLNAQEEEKINSSDIVDVNEPVTTEKLQNPENLNIPEKETTNNTEISKEIEQEKNETLKPTPKKRGPKKKKEKIEVQQNNITDLELQTSRRGRKRKAVNYFALSKGDEMDTPEIINVAKKRKRNTSSFSENANITEGIVQIDTTISCNSNDNEIYCTYTAQEIIPSPKETPKRKRGRPPRIKTNEPIQEKTNNVDNKETNELPSTSGQKTIIKTENTQETNEPSPTTENKTNSQEANEANSLNQTSEVSSSDVSNTNSSTRRRRGRPRREASAAKTLLNTMFQHINTPSTDKDETNDDTLNTTENSSIIENVFVKEEFQDTKPDESVANKKGKRTKEPKKKRGRKKATVQPNSENELLSSGPTIICAVCEKELPKAAWGNHKLRYHNNLAWRVGDPPLDLNDQKLVMSILSDIYKRRKPLYCEKCGESKKSVLGYLSHKAMCQKSTEELTAMRLKCEFCERTVLPVSMVMHLKYCRANLNNLNGEESITEISQDNCIPVQGKRQAAEKAHKLIKSLKEEETVETTKHKKRSARWYVNFDFKPTYFGTKRFRTEILKNGIIKCRFEDCQFETSNVEEISNHLYACDKKPTEGFTCKFCIKTFKTTNDIQLHCKEEHSSVIKQDETALYEDRSDGEELEEEYLDDCEDGDKIIIFNKYKINRSNLLHGIKFLLKHRYCVPNTQIIYPPSSDWTLKFCIKNFSVPNLFPKWRTTKDNWEKLQPTLIANYLPHLKYSACTNVIENNKFVDPLKLDHQWKNYKLFEATSFNTGTSMIFCGGPIFAMAWAPTPYDKKDCTQILAISANSDVNKGYTLDKKYSESGLIQFWNCGLLKNETGITEPPKLEFCIAHDYGPIWHLEWCPSGCYDILPNPEENHSLQRLGILAIASGNSHIYLYSVCTPGQISGKILKPKPILKLVIDSVLEHAANDLEPHVTRISWSKASGHQYLAAGYANGMVAVYYLNTTSSLLKLGTDQNGVETLMPYRVFTAHNHAVTVLSLYHLNDGKRWILTGSVDRTIKYWDLENPEVPLTTFSKYIVTDGVWLNHWLSSIHCFDDSCAGGLTYTLAHQARNFESDYASVMHSNSRVTTITGNEWLNGFVQGNVAGELQGFFPHQMFYAMDGDKSFKNKKVILGYTRLVEKNLTIKERLEKEQQKLEKIYSTSTETNNEIKISLLEPSTYEKAQEKYGLVFCDMTLNSARNFTDNIESYYQSNKFEKLYTTRPNIFPMQSITKVAFNPNHESFLYLATGYQAGFVRISYMKFFNRKRK